MPRLFLREVSVSLVSGCLKERDGMDFREAVPVTGDVIHSSIRQPLSAVPGFQRDAFSSGRPSNQEIADGLFLSVRTVERHISTIYQKLEIKGRAARASAAAFAMSMQA